MIENKDIHSPEGELSKLPPVMAKLFKRFQAGELELHVYRGSTPSNTWLAEKGNAYAMVHSDTFMGALPAFLRYADADDSVEKVPSGGILFSRQKNEPLRTVYTFNKDKLKQATSLWKYACKCADSFNNLAGSLKADLRTADQNTRDLARTLKTTGAVRITGWIEPRVSTLCAMGLGTVTPEGFLLPTEKLKQAILLK